MLEKLFESSESEGEQFSPMEPLKKAVPMFKFKILPQQFYILGVVQVKWVLMMLMIDHNKKKQKKEKII